MGLGITLGSNGLLAELGGGEGGDGNGGGRSRGWQGEKIEMTGGAEASLAPPVVKVGVECPSCTGMLHSALFHDTPSRVFSTVDSRCGYVI